MIVKKDLYCFIAEFQSFEKAIERMEKAISGRKYGCNLFETDWYESVGKMLDTFLESHFTEDGCDLITWWLFEDVDHIIYEHVDPDLFNGEIEIEYDVNEFDRLWSYMVKHEKDYFKV